MNQQKLASGRGGFEFVEGRREGDFVVAFYRDPNGQPPNQTKAFRADGADVLGGDIIRDEDAFRGVRLERFWYNDMSETMRANFRRCAGVRSAQELIWSSGQEPVSA